MFINVNKSRFLQKKITNMTILKNYKNISKICLSTESHPKVKEWINKTYPKTYIKGNF